MQCGECFFCCVGCKLGLQKQVECSRLGAVRALRRYAHRARPTGTLRPYSEITMNSETKKSLIKILIVLVVSGCMLLIPTLFPDAPITEVQSRVVALFVLAALMWILEPIPIWTTSVLVITLSLLCISNQSLTFLRPERFDKAEVKAIIADAVGSDAAAHEASIKQKTKDGDKFLKPIDVLQTDVLARLKKKPSLDSAEVFMSINYLMLNAGEKAARAAETAAAAGDTEKAAYQAALSAQMNKAADRLSEDPALNKRIKDLKITNLMQQKSTMATFADPIIILFLGGFFLAAAATKYRLDINLAKVLLKPFGTNPKYVMLGLMVVTALFSMFMSNTATAAMMLAILGPVLALFKPDDRGRAAFALCIPVAANIGGIGTPIGTPPNAIALKAMGDMGLNVSFGKWMLFGVPFVIVMLLVGWVVLVKMFPIKEKSIKLEVGGTFLKTPKAIIVYVTFIVTVLLWMLGSGVHGLDSNTIAIIPIAVFSVTQVITKDDLKKMSWDVLWLVAGGFALGVALEQTGLAKDLINAIPFDTWDPMMLMIGAGCICLFMATFMSHTATASLLMPILAAVAGAMVSSGSMENPGAIGLLVAIAFASSLGMALPISTPPNALAYATGLVESKGMAISGTILCLLGLVLTIVVMTLLMNVGFFG